MKQLGWLLALGLAMTSAGVAQAETFPAGSLKGIDVSLEANLALGKAAIAPDSLSLTAYKGSDFYDTTLNAPTVLFPVKGDFVFTTRVTVAFQNTFDGGAVMLYADEKHWVKFLIERSQPGMEGVTSTVVKGEGDDAYHIFLTPAQTSVWMRVTRKGGFFVLYTSLDGKTWTLARDFTLDPALPLKLGFEAQSPLGDACTAKFDNIRYEIRTPNDYWHGE